jgi:predicted NAD-dependent protein-ADP-ribosyltransferase YbiA (DUF1768 family)
MSKVIQLVDEVAAASSSPSSSSSSLPPNQQQVGVIAAAAATLARLSPPKKLVCTRVTLNDEHFFYVGPKKSFKDKPLLGEQFLHQSKWHVPHVKSLSEYREYIVQNCQHFQLSELKGKTLVCLCSLTKRCHANILIYLLHNGEHFGEIVEYQSDTSCFSNSYKFDFTIGKSFNNNLLHFHSLAHAYYYFMGTSKQFPNKYLNKILNAKCLTSVVEIWKNEVPDIYLKKPCSVDKICLMYMLLNLKLKTCVEFHKTCIKNKNALFVQLSPDKFWGCGSLKRKYSPQNYEGQNIASALIMLLIELKIKKQKKHDPAELFHAIKLKINICTEGMLNVNFVEGVVKMLIAVYTQSKIMKCKKLLKI